MQEVRDTVRDSRDRTRSDHRDQRRLELLTIETDDCNLVSRFAKEVLSIGTQLLSTNIV